MTDNDTTEPESGRNDEPQQGLPRRNRGVRFSDLEWEEVRQAAQARGVTPAEFVRERILELVRNPTAGDAVSNSADLTPLIERIFRSTHILATLKRDELVREGRDGELEKLIKSTRKLQESLLDRTEG